MLQRTRFADLPLQRKLFLLFALATLFALLIAAALVAVYEITTYRPRAHQEALGWAQSIASTMTAAVEFNDASTANRYLRAFGQQRDIRALAIVMADGTTFAEYAAPGTQRIDFSAAAARELERMDGDVIVSQPIKARVETNPVLWMRIGLTPFSDRLIAYALLLGAAALTLLGLMIVLSLLVRRTISEPVQQLAAAAREVTERRDYSRRVPSPRHDEVGQLAHAFNTMLATVEERELALKSSEEVARRQLAVTEAIYASAQVGLCVIDHEGRYIRVNQRLAELVGRRVDELLGHTMDEVVPDLAPTLLAIAQDVFETGAPVHDVEVHRTANDSRGDNYWIVSQHPLSDRSGTIVGVNMVVVDITARRRAEQERLALEGQLRQSQKMEALGTLAGGIAHDFNNVLTAIGGNAQLGLEDLPPEHPATVALREIRRGVERARDLVRRILAFSRPEQNVQRIIDVRPIAEEAIRLLRATEPKTIDIRLDAAPDLPQVRADATQIHQVLVNLGTNACDAMQRSGGVLTIRLRGVRTDSRLQALYPDITPGHYLRISVEDTGTGIEPAVLDRIFEPFFTTKPPGEGTGLGLSVVHGIMRGHHGGILVHSKVGEGTSFDLYLPAATEPSERPDEPERALVPHAGEGERILYVDDEEQLVFLVTRMMERMGYRVRGMTHPREAIEAVRENPGGFDLIISDLGMPEMSGLDLAAQLIAIRADLPIIITSGYVRPEDKIKADRLGVRDIVLKPNTVAEMSELIRERLSGLKARPA